MAALTKQWQRLGGNAEQWKVPGGNRLEGSSNGTF